jgi:hypothetical protein
MWGRPALIVAFALLATGGLADELRPLQIGAWRGGVDRDASGRFSSCSAGAASERASLLLSTRDGVRWKIKLVGPASRFRAGLAIPVDVSFAGRAEPFRLAGAAGEDNAVSASLPPGALAAFSAAPKMHVVLAGVGYDFDLTSSSELISLLRNCVLESSLVSSWAANPEPTPPSAAPVSPVVASAVPYKPDERSQIAFSPAAAATPPALGPSRAPSVLASATPPRSGSTLTGAQHSSSRAITLDGDSADSTDIAPNFVPWPPPMPTSSYAYPFDWVRRHATVGDISADIEALLTKSGYTQFSYSIVPGGFALATRFERVEQDETPTADIARWAPLGASVPQSWLDMVKALFRGRREGQCRLFVFFLTTDDKQPSHQAAMLDEARTWSLGGTPRLPNSLSQNPLTAKHRFYAYEYEFIEEPSRDIVELRDSFVPLEQQLRVVKLLP